MTAVALLAWALGLVTGASGVVIALFLAAIRGK